MLNRRAAINILILGLIKKYRYVKISYFPETYTRSEGEKKV